MSKDLKHFLKKIFAKDAHEKLAVADAKLGQAIKSKLEIDCVADSSISELMRCVFITKNFPSTREIQDWKIRLESRFCYYGIRI